MPMMNSLCSDSRTNFSMPPVESARSASASPTAENALKTGYFCRALIYFGLTTRWGAAPVLEKTTNEEVPLTQAEGLYAFMLSDLAEATTMNDNTVEVRKYEE